MIENSYQYIEKYGPKISWLLGVQDISKNLSAHGDKVPVSLQYDVVNNSTIKAIHQGRVLACYLLSYEKPFSNYVREIGEGKFVDVKLFIKILLSSHMMDFVFRVSELEIGEQFINPIGFDEFKPLLALLESLDSINPMK